MRIEAGGVGGKHQLREQDFPALSVLQFSSVMDKGTLLGIIPFVSNCLQECKSRITK